MDKETKKEFEKLGRMIQDGFKKSEKRTDEKIDALGRMVKQGFDGVDKRFDENAKQHKEMKEKLFELGQEKEDIKSDLDKRAYTFELRDLAKRLRRCETKLGITY